METPKLYLRTSSWSSMLHFIINTTLHKHTHINHLTVTSSNESMLNTASSSSLAAAQARPQQTSPLLRLPEELILEIAAQPCLGAKDLATIAHTSSALLRICNPPASTSPGGAHG